MADKPCHRCNDRPRDTASSRPALCRECRLAANKAADAKRKRKPRKPVRNPNPPVKLSLEARQDRAKQAAALHDAGKTWSQIMKQLGYTSTESARTSARNWRKKHPNADVPRETSPHVTDPSPPTAATPPNTADGVAADPLSNVEGDRYAKQATARRRVGMPWSEIAELLGYPDAEAARQAWAERQEARPPLSERERVRYDRWEFLWRQAMTQYGEAQQAGNKSMAAASLRQAQALLATEPGREIDGIQEIAGRELADHFADRMSVT